MIDRNGLRERLLAPSRPLPHIDSVRSNGSWIHRTDGSRVLDGSSGLVCANVGHSSARVAERVRRQLERGAFAGPATQWPDLQLELLERLCAAVNRPEDSVALTTSGTSGIEMAIALARIAARAQSGGSRHQVLTSSLSYHGNSAFTLALSGHRRRRPDPADAFGVEPSFPAPYPGFHLCEYGHSCDEVCADVVAEAIDARGAENVAAVLLEPVNGTTGGAFVPPEGYLKRVAKHCRDRGVILVHDEVLTGLWRAGRPLASDHWEGAAPDICVLSKGLGAGYTSVGAVMVSPRVAAMIEGPRGRPLPMMGTMAATPLQAAVCLGVLDELNMLGPEHVAQGGIDLGGRLRDACPLGPVVRDIRGLGYFYGIEVQDGTLWTQLARLERQGVLLYPFTGYRPDGTGEGMIVAPPLTSTEDDIEHLISTLRTVLESASVRESSAS